MFDISTLTNIDTPTTNRPYGVMRDDVLPGDETGTEVEEQVYNDLYYPLIAILDRAGLTPDGSDEGVSNSQVADAVEAIGKSADDNLLYNSDFKLWQRGLTHAITSTVNNYYPDRLKCKLNTYTSGTLSILKNTIESETNFERCAEFDFTSLVHTGNFQARQILETKNVVPLRNKKVIAKIKIKAIAGVSFTFKITDGTDTDAEPVTSTTVSQKTIALTTSYQEFTLLHTVQSGANSLKVEVITTDAYSGKFFVQYMSLNRVNNNFEYENIVLYEQRSFLTELMLCQRYYEKTYDTDTTPGSVAGSGAINITIGYFEPGALSFISGSFEYKTKKRIAVVFLTVWTPGGTASKVSLNGVNTDYGVPTSGEGHVYISASNTNTDQTKVLSFHAAADAEI